MSDRHLLAGRLCLELGIDDPVAWLESVPREVLQFWMAFDRIEPIGGSKQDLAQLAYEVAMLRHLYVTVHLKESAEAPEPPEFSNYMPLRWLGAPKPKKKKSPDGFAIGKALMGTIKG